MNWSPWLMEKAEQEENAKKDPVLAKKYQEIENFKKEFPSLRHEIERMIRKEGLDKTIAYYNSI